MNPEHPPYIGSPNRTFQPLILIVNSSVYKDYISYSSIFIDHFIAKYRLNVSNLNIESNIIISLDQATSPHTHLTSHPSRNLRKSYLSTMIVLISIFFAQKSLFVLDWTFYSQNLLTA